MRIHTDLRQLAGQTIVNIIAPNELVIGMLLDMVDRIKAEEAKAAEGEK